MLLESLPINVYENNGKSFAKSEGHWKPLQDTSESYLKRLFDSTKDIITLTRPWADVADYDWESVLERLKSGKVVKDAYLFFRIKNDLLKCPNCGCSYEKIESALSRKDNETEICTDCGISEALS